MNKNLFRNLGATNHSPLTREANKMKIKFLIEKTELIRNEYLITFIKSSFLEDDKKYMYLVRSYTLSHAIKEARNKARKHNASNARLVSVVMGRQW